MHIKSQLAIQPKRLEGTKTIKKKKNSLLRSASFGINESHKIPSKILSKVSNPKHTEVILPWPKIVPHYTKFPTTFLTPNERYYWLQNQNS